MEVVTDGSCPFGCPWHSAHGYRHEPRRCGPGRTRPRCCSRPCEAGYSTPGSARSVGVARPGCHCPIHSNWPDPPPIPRSHPVSGSTSDKVGSEPRVGIKQPPEEPGVDRTSFGPERKRSSPVPLGDGRSAERFRLPLLQAPDPFGGVASEVLNVSSVSRKGTNARHWSLEQLRMWRAWVRRYSHTTWSCRRCFHP